MKRIIFLLFLAFVCNDLKAQIYHSEVCYYMRAGESLTENTDITIVSFEGQTITSCVLPKNVITTRLKESPDYWDDWVSKRRGSGWKYSSKLSTDSREVYSMGWPNSTATSYIGTFFRAFSTDLSSYIFWGQKYNSETIERKMHYMRIDKSDLMPNENLYDFLND